MKTTEITKTTRTMKTTQTATNKELSVGSVEIMETTEMTKTTGIRGANHGFPKQQAYKYPITGRRTPQAGTPTPLRAGIPPSSPPWSWTSVERGEGQGVGPCSSRGGPGLRLSRTVGVGIPRAGTPSRAGTPCFSSMSSSCIFFLLVVWDKDQGLPSLAKPLHSDTKLARKQLPLEISFAIFNGVWHLQERQAFSRICPCNS